MRRSTVVAVLLVALLAFLAGIRLVTVGMALHGEAQFIVGVFGGLLLVLGLIGVLEAWCGLFGVSDVLWITTAHKDWE